MTAISKEAANADLRRSIGERAVRRPPRPTTAKTEGGPSPAAAVDVAPSAAEAKPIAIADGAIEIKEAVAGSSAPALTVAGGPGSAGEGRSGVSPPATAKPVLRKRGQRPDETDEAYYARLVQEAAEVLKKRKKKQRKGQRARLNADFNADRLKLKAYLAKSSAENPFRRFESLADIGARAWAKGMSLEELQEMIDLFKKTS